MLHRSPFAALLTGGLVLACSWPILAQHPSNAPSESSQLSEAPQETPFDPHPIERLPDAPPSDRFEAEPVLTPSPVPTELPTSPPSDAGEPPATTKPNAQPRPNTASLRTLAQRLKLPLPLPKARIVVLKSQRRLDLYNANTLVKSYRVALGKNPDGHKQRQGDGRTPEGQFYVCTRNSRTSAFHIFLGLSYPALPDATRAVKNKAITEREFNTIRGRLASRSAPLWETRLGGWVGIHGGSDGNFARKRTLERGRPDWTAGCIAVTNREIEEIHAATRMGTSVVVKP